jgi:hypothetical protein
MDEENFGFEDFIEELEDGTNTQHIEMVYDPTDVMIGLQEIHHIVDDLLATDAGEFLNGLAYLYVNLKTNKTIREKALKLNIKESVLYGAYYKIFLKKLRIDKNPENAYREVHEKTFITENVIKSISGSKSNHIKHIRKIISKLKKSFGVED